MKEYILSVSVTIMVCVVANLLVPSQKYAGVIKIVCGLFVVSILINPIKNIFKNKLYSFHSGFSVRDEYFETSAVNAKRTFDEIIKAKKEELTSAELSAEVKKLWDSSLIVEIRGKEARVHNADTKDFKEIKNYLKDRYGLVAVSE